MSSLNLLLIAIFPVLPIGLGFFFYDRQNSKKAWTGGPISYPKAFWLSYTVSTWFLFPLLIYFGDGFDPRFKSALCFHLASWWIRGPLELLMIYRWFNWSPKYGMTHDALHIIGIAMLTPWLAIMGIHTDVPPELALRFWEQDLRIGIPGFFLLITVFATFAEGTFAILFLRARSKAEANDNVYFASDDPKWKFINRLSATVCTVVYTHLVLQTAILGWYLIQISGGDA